MVTQEFLAAVLRDRLARAGTATDAADADAADALTAVAVLRRFHAASFAESALRFAVELEPTQRKPWLRAFTRTVFLAGNPANLQHRFGFAHVTADRAVAWCTPGPAGDFTALRRMLKLFPAGRLALPARIPLRAPGGSDSGAQAHRLWIATAGLTTASYLVHLNHTLAEAVLTGLVRPGDRLVLDHLPDLADATVQTAAMIRVHRDLTDPQRLRAYTCLATASRSLDT